MTKQIKKRSEDVEKVLSRLSSGRNPKRPLSLDETAEGLTACYLNGASLLDDARLLAAHGRQPRALSLTILALEELAKVPDLGEIFLDPRTRSEVAEWTEFWKRFAQHKPKQKRIAAYGNILRKSTNIEEIAFENPSPFANYLSDEVYGHLDNVKQRNFYADFLGKRFERPEISNDLLLALDTLFAFAEERADSFGPWHITAQRSMDFLVARLKVFSFDAAELPEQLNHISSFNGWASSHTAGEAGADLLRLLCYYSSAMIPDYDGFHSECEIFLSPKLPSERMELLHSSVSTIQQRREIKLLPKSQNRAFLMFKLLFSYSRNHLSDVECLELFGFL
jgi:AbiV family abortive infection protein